MIRLKAFFHPSVKGGLTWARYCLLCLFVSASVIAHTMFPGLLGAFWVNGQSAPSVAALHIYNVQYIVHSQSWWDAASCECTPVDDVDYMFPYGVQEPARLPGGPWAHYRLLTYGYIPGSGYFLTVLAPNFGHISWYHLAWYTTANGLDGGDQIGLTSWPTDPVYGNGTSGMMDAHMCISFDAAGAWWLMDALNHPPPAPRPKPKPRPVFPVAQWNGPIDHWNAGHPHKRQAHIPYRWHGKLSRVAADAWHSGMLRRIGGPLHAEVWDGRRHVMHQVFGFRVGRPQATVWSWPTLRHDPLRYEAHHRTIRVSR